jgi:hypothetical protein
MLDEGIDIPDAEIGINVSSSKTRLQLVQRMGRILRMKKDKKPVFHHFLAVPGPEFFIENEDNLAFLDDISWVQDTALKMGVNAELEKDDIPYEQLRLDSEKMIQERYHEKEIKSLPGYGTLRLKNIINSFTTDVINKIISQLNEIDTEHIITNTEWANIIRIAHDKNINDPLNIPGYWWILVLGKRNSKFIKLIFKDSDSI